MGINWLAVAIAGASAFLLGGLWYSPILFGLTWMHEAGMADKIGQKKSHGPKVFFLAYLWSFLAALGFRYILAANGSFWIAIGMSCLVGFCFAASSLAINYLFAGRSFKLFLIDGGYHVFQFLLYGIVFSIMH